MSKSKESPKESQGKLGRDISLGGLGITGTGLGTICQSGTVGVNLAAALTGEKVVEIAAVSGLINSSVTVTTVSSCLTGAANTAITVASTVTIGGAVVTAGGVIITGVGFGVMSHTLYKKFKNKKTQKQNT